jgi:hypothetical protein
MRQCYNRAIRQKTIDGPDKCTKTRRESTRGRIAARGRGDEHEPYSTTSPRHGFRLQKGVTLESRNQQEREGKNERIP